MTRHKMVVRPHRPFRNGVIYTILAVLVLVAVAGAFEFGRLRAGFDASEANRERDRMSAEIESLSGLNRELRERIALLERSSEIDRQARDQVQGSLSEMQDEVLELREELAFYRGIVSPEDGQAGLRVQNFRLSRGQGDRLYGFRLVLIQAVKHDKRATGQVEITVHGMQGGEPVSVPLQDLLVGDSAALRYSFKYFQDFEGNFRLPEGFTPARVDVAVLPGGSSANSIRRSITWDEAAS